MLADPAFFLGHTTPVDVVTFGRLGSGDAANSGHNLPPEKSEEHGTSLRVGQGGKRPSPDPPGSGTQTAVPLLGLDLAFFRPVARHKPYVVELSPYQEW